jgi:hypothetical protein
VYDRLGFDPGMRHRFFLPLLLWTGSIQRSRYSSLRCRLRPIPALPPPCRLVRGRGSRQLRIVAMASPPAAAVHHEAGAVRADRWSLQASGPSVMRARALTGAAGSGCGRPGDESSGHHQTERLAGLDEAEQRGWWIEGCLPCHPILYRKVPDRPSDYGGGRWASRWELLPSDTRSEGRSTAGCPAMARLVIPLVIPPAITRQVRNTLAGRAG